MERRGSFGGSGLDCRSACAWAGVVLAGWCQSEEFGCFFGFVTVRI